MDDLSRYGLCAGLKAPPGATCLFSGTGPSTGNLTDTGAPQKDGYLVFDTTHFSYYAVAQLRSRFSSGSYSTPVSNPKAGDEIILMTT